MLTALRQTRCALTQTLLALALVAAGLQAWTPPGLMLAEDAQGRLAFTLCSGSGPSQFWLDPETRTWTSEAPDEDAAQTGAPCSLGAVAQLGAPPAETLLATIAPAVFHSAPPFRATPRAGPPAPPPPARAPPVQL